MQNMQGGLKSLGRKANPEMDAYLSLVSALVLQDYNNLWSCDKQARRDLLEISNRTHAEGLSFLTKTLPALGKALDKALSLDLPFAAPTGFKTRKDSALPLFSGDVLERIFSGNGSLRSDPCPRSVCCIRQLAYMFYKLELPSDSATEQSVLQNFVDVDQGLPLEIPDDPTLRYARQLIWWVLRDVDWSLITPGHGPGSVATRERPSQKGGLKRVYASMDKLYPFTEYCLFNANHVDEFEYTDLEFLPVPQARVTLVPKDSRGPRIISMEPLEVQFIQQGLKDLLYRTIETHPITAGHVNFTNQDINRDLALEGSLDPSTVTLDMKEASDRVSLGLAEQLFGSSTIWPYLLACRSHSTVLPDDREVTLNKFAPMGSALCFPVESLVFWAISVATVAHLQPNAWRSARKQVWVYGDDLVVPYGSYEAIIANLERYHLLVNRDKCCTSQIAGFRESCGLDAFRGHIVSPLRIKRPVTKATTDWTPSWVAQGNLAYTRGLKGLANAIEGVVNSHSSRYAYTTCVVGVVTHVRPYACKALNQHIRVRYNSERQLWELRGLRVETQTAPPLYGGYRECLSKWRSFVGVDRGALDGDISKWAFLLGTKEYSNRRRIVRSAWAAIRLEWL